MSEPKRYYRDADKAALIWLCGGSCYWPGCRNPVLADVNGKHVMALEIAHIHAFKPGGARYKPNLDHGVSDFANLLLLCHPHHVVVDHDGAGEYPATLLLQWKAERERDRARQLRGLGEVTPESLQELILDAFAERTEQIQQTLKRLERNDAEAAQLLRSMCDELTEIRTGGIDVEAAMMLNDAARQLRDLQDDADTLNTAAERLGHLTESADTLYSAAQILNGLWELAHELDGAAQRLLQAGKMF